MGRPVRVIADDLTGAADAGATLLGGERAVLLTLGSAGGHWRDPDVPAVATDTATRDGTPDEAAAAVAALAGDLPEGADLVVKVDSALRGHIAVEVAALRDVLPDHLVILAPAFPRNQRVTRAGVQHVRGVPLHLGDLWALEAAAPPESVAALLAPISSVPVHLDVIRESPVALRRALDSAAKRCGVAVCDAETDGDLDRLVAAVGEGDTPVVWVGAAGLAAAVGRAGRAGGELARPGQPLRRVGPYLGVIGSAASAAKTQAAVLRGEGRAASVELPVAALAAGEAETLEVLGQRLVASVGVGDTVVTIGGPLESELAPAISRSLAAVTAPAARLAAALVLTGGATARAVLEATGTTALHLVEELDPGIVLARPTDRDGVPVITKSGAFGDDRTLLRAVQRITVEEGSTPRAS